MQANNSAQETQDAVDNLNKKCISASEKAAALKPEVESKVSEVNKIIEAFKAETEQKLAFSLGSREKISRDTDPVFVAKALIGGGGGRQGGG